MKSLIVLALAGVTLIAEAAVIPFQTGNVFGEARRFGDEQGTGAQALAIEAGRLYVGGKGFLSVFDVSSDSMHPRLIGTTTDMATVRQVAVQDGMAYAVTRENGLWIVDCRNDRVVTVGHLPSTSNCTGVDVAGDVCFVGGSKSGLDFVDVSDPTHPQLIRHMPFSPSEVQSVAYRDGLLYWGDWAKCGMWIMDCRDMCDVRRLSHADLVSNGDGIWPQGKWLYASTGWNLADKKKPVPRLGQMGLTVFDVEDPKHPKEVGRVDFEYCVPQGVDMWIPRASGDLVFCAQNQSGLYAVDVSDKTKPHVLDRWTWNPAKGDRLAPLVAEGRPSRCVASVAIGNGVVYVAGPGGLGAWAIEAKGAVEVPIVRGTPPVHASLRPTPGAVPEGFVRWLPKDETVSACVTGLAVKDDVCYAACGTAGLYMLSLSDDGIAEIGSVSLPECLDAAIAGNRLFVATGRGGYIGYEILAPGRLKEFMRFPMRSARDVYAYGDGTKWVVFNSTIYDITDPAAPKPLVSLVHQARWNKFMCPDLIAGRWAIGNTALNYFGVADMKDEQAQERKVAGYRSGVGAMCPFGDKALMVDNRKWAFFDPMSDEVIRATEFPKEGFTGGIPRACGTTVVIAGAKQVGVWDFSDPFKPIAVKEYAFSDVIEPVSFWRGHMVLPGRSLGVLMPKTDRRDLSFRLESHPCDSSNPGMKQLFFRTSFPESGKMTYTVCFKMTNSSGGSTSLP